MGRRARALGRCLLLLLGVAVTAELGLRLARPTPSAPALVLCVGDSYTHGEVLGDHSLPAGLQQQLDARAPGAYRVVDLGIPGVNSAMVARRFPETLLRYRPDLVILWIGANNRSLESEAAHWRSGRPPRALPPAVLRSALLRWLWRQRLGPRPEPLTRATWVADALPREARWRVGDEELGWEIPTGAPVPIALAEAGAALDLGYMVAVARALDVPIVLLTYPERFFRTATRAVERVAREQPVAVVDTRRDLARAQADGIPYEDLIAHELGPHPTARFMPYVVASVLPRVLERLPPPSARRGP